MGCLCYSGILLELNFVSYKRWTQRVLVVTTAMMVASD